MGMAEARGHHQQLVIRYHLSYKVPRRVTGGVSTLFIHCQYSVVGVKKNLILSPACVRACA